MHAFFTADSETKHFLTTGQGLGFNRTLLVTNYQVYLAIRVLLCPASAIVSFRAREQCCLSSRDGRSSSSRECRQPCFRVSPAKTLQLPAGGVVSYSLASD